MKFTKKLLSLAAATLAMFKGGAGVQKDPFVNRPQVRKLASRNLGGMLAIDKHGASMERNNQNKIRKNRRRACAAGCKKAFN